MEQARGGGSGTVTVQETGPRYVRDICAYTYQDGNPERGQEPPGGHDLRASGMVPPYSALICPAPQLGEGVEAPRFPEEACLDGMLLPRLG